MIKDYQTRDEAGVATTPRPGDAVRLKKQHAGGFGASLADDAIGIIDGDGYGSKTCSIIFNYNCFRGPDSLYAKDQTERISVGGGPGTIATPVSELRFTGETITVNCWKWKTFPKADGGERYNIEVPLWEWTPPAATR